MEKPIMNPELPLPEVFKWRVPINWDPVPWWFFERANLPKEALSQLALIQLENQRAIMQQNMKAIEQSMEMVKKFGGKQLRARASVEGSGRHPRPYAAPFERISLCRNRVRHDNDRAWCSHALLRPFLGRRL